MSRYVTPEILRKYPYFIDWLKELERSPEDVTDYGIEQEMREVEPIGFYKQFLPTDNFVASMTFSDGHFVSRGGKFSDGKMLYEPIERDEE